MQCAQTAWLDDDEYFRQFNRKIVQERVPVYGTLALTHRCNLRCVHCYLSPQSTGGRAAAQEMGARELLPIIDEFTEAGCLWLLLTGGEPLLHRDFCEIYRHAKTNGLLVSVFTNGALISDEVLALFDDLPPMGVEISLYGATAATYERITGVPGSYRRCLRGIEALLNHGVRVKLKTILMSHNRHEFFDIERMAEAYGVEFRFDAAIFPRFDGDKEPVQLRVSPEEAVEKEFSDERRLRGCREYFEMARGIRPTDALYACGAGRILFHIDPDGTLTPCLMASEPRHNLRNGGFMKGWLEVMPQIERKRAPRDYECNRCDVRALCNVCPAFSALESGSEACRSEYLCAIAHHRHNAIVEEAVTSGRTGGRSET